VASPCPSSVPRQAALYGPYRHILGVRAIEWSTRFEECMLVSALAQDMEEDLASVEASVGDLVGASKGEGVAGKT
jgi:hypothetical protein